MVPILQASTLQASTQGFGVEQNPVSYDVGSLLVILMMMVLVPAIALSTYYLYRIWKNYKSVANESNELAQHLQRHALTREETFLMKQSLKQFHLKHPADIMKKPNVFDAVMKKTHERAGAHTEHLIQSIRKKIFS